MAVARRLGASILSVDSMQVYRGMDIGTAKPSVEERSQVTHHMIDLVEPSEDYTVAEFQRAGRGVVGTSPVIIVGGSGLHFRAIVDPLEFPPSDPEVRERLEAAEPAMLRAELEAIDPGAPIDMSNARRVVRAMEIYELTGDTPSMRAGTQAARAVAGYEPLHEFRAVGVDPGSALPERISHRLDSMRREGLLEEVARLAGRMGRTAAQAVGYKELLPVVANLASADDGFAAAAAATRRLAKRQRTYFRRDPRINWLPWCDDVGTLAERAFEELTRG